MKRNIMAIILLIQGISAWSQADKIDSLLNDVVWGDKETMRLLDPELSFFLGSESVELDQMGSQSGQQGTQTEITTENKYSLLNTRFYLPVCLYIGDFDLELGYSLNIPSTQDENMDYPLSSYFSFSIGYLIPVFNRKSEMLSEALN